MADELALDKRRLRQSFERAAAGYDAAAVLQEEVCRRMLARLEYIKIEPRAVLDAGSGTGNALNALRSRYSRSMIVPLDLALAMVERGRARLRWWHNLPGVRAPVHPVCADLERLPFAHASFGLVWSNLALQWMNELPRALSEVYRVLQPAGLFMFSTFGPDTLKELRRAYERTDGRTHVNRFVDMHDIGDMLVNAGYADPVLDMETFTLTYDAVEALMRDLKSIGAHNVTAGRPAGLSGKSLMASVRRSYESFRRDGKLPATFEVVYGHAWKPQPRVGPGGRRVIDIKAQ